MRSESDRQSRVIWDQEDEARRLRNQLAVITQDLNSKDQLIARLKSQASKLQASLRESNLSNKMLQEVIERVSRRCPKQ